MSAPAAKARIVRAMPSTAGVAVAAVGYAGALTPSLLPHAFTLLLLLTSVGTAAGYAIGATIGWLLRFIPFLRTWRAPRWSVIVLLAVLWLLALSFTPIAVGWQLEQQQDLSMPEPLPSSVVLIVASIVVAIALVLLGRSIRLGCNSLARLISRGPLARISPRWPRFGVALVAMFVASLLLNGALGLLVSSYNSDNESTAGQTPTNHGLNSGSPDSYTPWDTLGRQGRDYVDHTMTPAKITAITGQPAQTPVRVYVGMQQADTYDSRTALAIKELDRVGAWGRKYLVLFGVTGTGWIDPDAINSLETVTSGDVTTVGIQYSAVPSWIGFVIDPQTTIDQNNAMIHGIVDAWRAKPADQRPELVLFGQSLGSMGTQGAWTASDTPSSVTSDIKRIAWVGPPAASVLWSTWQADRTAGPAWDPVIGDGQITRVLVSAADTFGAEDKVPPTIVFAAHANDPVVYWSPDLLFSEPDWLHDPLGPGVSTHMRWIPILTFLQVGMDLIGGGEPPEVGHNYSANMAQSVALAVDADGWTPELTAKLQAALPGLKYHTD
jgi:uncharacterized membrane protein